MQFFCKAILGVALVCAMLDVHADVTWKNVEDVERGFKASFPMDSTASIGEWSSLSDDKQVSGIVSGCGRNIFSVSNAPLAANHLIQVSAEEFVDKVKDKFPEGFEVQMLVGLPSPILCAAEVKGISDDVSMVYRYYRTNSYAYAAQVIEVGGEESSYAAQFLDSIEILK